MKEWIEQNKDKIFRYWVKKRMWTPYDYEHKEEYPCDTTDEECSYCKITNAIFLGYDWLLELTTTINGENFEMKDYHRLSEIDLQYVGSDQENI